MEGWSVAQGPIWTQERIQELKKNDSFRVGDNVFLNTSFFLVNFFNSNTATMKKSGIYQVYIIDYQ